MRWEWEPEDVVACWMLVVRRALAPLFWSNASPYRRFRLDTERHLELQVAAPGLPGGPPLAVAASVE